MPAVLGCWMKLDDVCTYIYGSVKRCSVKGICEF